MNKNMDNYQKDQLAGLPRNVKQIGETEKGRRIYIEDYAYTYVHQFAEKNSKEEQIAFLIGSVHEYEDEKIILISGAITGEALIHESNKAEFSEESWLLMEKKMDKYFRGSRVLGWLYTQPGYGILLTSYLVAKHREFFHEEGMILYLIDPIEKDEGFFMTDQEDLKQVSGFFIYYDKNTRMHEYMLDNRIKQEVKSEIAVDTAIKNYRIKEQERKEEGEQRRFVRLLTAVSGALLIICMIIGVGLIGNIERTNGLKKSLEEVIKDYASLERDFVIQNEGRDHIDGNSSDYSENVPAVNINEGSQDLIINREQSADNTEANEALTSNDGLGSTESPIQDTIDIPETYIVQPGDNLIKISYRFYDNKEMVPMIEAANDIKNIDKIYVGQELILPRP